MFIAKGIEPTEHYINRCNLSADGFIIKPHPWLLARIAAGEITQPFKMLPGIIAPIPNLTAFAEGPDIFGHGVIVKAPKQDEAYIPMEWAAFVPCIQQVINHAYVIDPAAARRRRLLVKPSRHTSAAGFTHQPHFPDWHNHRLNGPSSYYLTSDVAGTQFPDWTAPDGHTIRFEEEDIHSSPVMPGSLRRTLLVNAFYDKDPDPRNELKLDHNPLRQVFIENPLTRSSFLKQWTSATAELLAPIYDEEAQRGDIAGWLKAIEPTHHGQLSA